MGTYIGPFQPGEAVYHLKHPGRMDATPTIRTGVVTRVNGKHISVQWNDGTRSTVGAHALAYVGCCIACVRPAIVVEGRLTCPQCEGPADTTPPPAIIARLLHEHHDLRQLVIYHLVVEELRDKALWDAARGHGIREWEAKQRRHREAEEFVFALGLQTLRELKEDGELDTLVRDALAWKAAICEVDQEPSTTTNDAFADWLERQMGRAA